MRTLIKNCVTCGDKLDLERAEKYDYCTKPECQERNARGLRMVAVGVNKAADQYVVLDERTEREMAGGRYKKQPDVPGTTRRPTRNRALTKPARSPLSPPRSSAGPSHRQWSEAQNNLALIYRAMGMKPKEIAKKLGVSLHLVTQILLAATAHGRQ